LGPAGAAKLPNRPEVIAILASADCVSAKRENPSALYLHPYAVLSSCPFLCLPTRFDYLSGVFFWN
jgi:hypothetical protein